MYKSIGKIATMLAIIGVLLMPLATAQQGPGGQMGGPVPEIEITGIQFSDTNAIEGQDVIISVTVENLNTTASASGITLSLYLDYAVVQNFTDIQLDAGESATFNYVWTSESGTHNVTAILLVNGMPLQDTQVSEELIVSLGDPLSLVLAILVLMLAIFIIAILPSIVKKLRG